MIVAIQAVVISMAIRGHLARPESVYGIVPGLSEEANVVALYGPGYFEDKDGDTGRRTYITSAPRAVVRFVFGTDKVVESIEIDTEAPPPHLSPTELKRITVRLEPPHWYGADVAHLLAKGRSEVEEWYGTPAEDGKSATWTYVTPDSDTFLGSRLEVTFRNGRVVKIVIIGDSDD